MKRTEKIIIYTSISAFVLLLSYIMVLSSGSPAAKAEVNPIGQEYSWWLEKVNYINHVPQVDIKHKVTVAVIDTGVDHDSLPASNIIQGYNLVDNNINTKDKHGHGTKCAYLIASPKLGINPYAVILPVKVRKDMSDDPKIVSEGIKWAADNGADIISLSIGKAPTKNNHHLGYREGVEYALEKGLLLIAASGSNGKDIFYPAAFDGVVCVGGLDKELNYKYELNTDEIDIFAVDTKDDVSSSYPTAIVAGAVSLVMSLEESLSAEDAMKIILDTSDIIEIRGKKARLLNVDNAIKAVKGLVQSE